MNDGSAFPARDLAIILAAGVIIMSLVSASFSLPFLLRGLELPPEPSQQEGEDRARIAAAEAHDWEETSTGSAHDSEGLPPIAAS